MKKIIISLSVLVLLSSCQSVPDRDSLQKMKSDAIPMVIIAGDYFPPDQYSGDAIDIFKIEFVLGPNGQVYKPKVLESTDPELNAGALRAIRKWRFKPLMVNDIPKYSLSHYKLYYQKNYKKKMREQQELNQRLAKEYNRAVELLRTDQAAGWQLMKKVANKGSGDALAALAYLEFQKGGEASQSKAMLLFDKAINIGFTPTNISTEMFFYKAKMLLFGIGMKKDRQKAEQLLRSDALKNHNGANALLKKYFSTLNK